MTSVSPTPTSATYASRAGIYPGKETVKNVAVLASPALPPTSQPASSAQGVTTNLHLESAVLAPKAATSAQLPLPAPSARPATNWKIKPA